MKHITFLAILFSLTFLLESCKNRCEGTQHKFELPVSLSPARETYHIGDTITITSTFSDKVYDRETNRIYTMDNFKFYPGSVMFRIDTIGSIGHFTNSFQVIVPDSLDYDFYTYNNGRQDIYGQYNYSNHQYYLTFKIIPKATGLFLMKQAVDTDAAELEDFKGKCKGRIGFGVAMMLNGRVDENGNVNENNVHLLLESPDSHYNDWIYRRAEQRFHRGGGYCFRVVE